MARKKIPWKISIFQEKPWYQSKKDSSLSMILKLSANIISLFPKSIRNKLMKWIDVFGLSLIRIFNILPFLTKSYYHIKGLTKDNNVLSILYQGDIPSLMFLLEKLFHDTNKIDIETIEKRLENKNKINSLKKQTDLIILEKDWIFNHFYQKKGYFIIPENISFILPIKESTEKIVNKCSQSIQRDLKKAIAFGYQFNISNDYNEFKIFYKTMYQPYVTWKYQDRAKIISFDAMKHFALRGSNILFINLKNEKIFGGIFEIEKQKIITQYAGIKKEKFNHLHHGVLALSYYFLIDIAQKYEIKAIDFGTSTPFLYDGLCRYKLRWNMRITKTKPVFSTIFAIKINNNFESVSSFFNNNPFFYVKNNELALAYFIKSNENKNIKTKEIIKQNHLKGISPNLYYTFDEFIKEQKYV
jgi:hypothetical protein